MRYFDKQAADSLLIFNEWKTENEEIIQEWIENPEKTGDNLWEELGKTFSVEKETDIDPSVVRHDLETTLFEEQHGLCCYCGNAIERIRDAKNESWIYRHRAIEHFEPKNRFKNKTFDYNNLMLCCKESQRLTIFEVGRAYKGTRIQNFEDVAKYVNLPQSVIKAHPKNSDISKRQLRNDDKIYVPNPPHCDDEKSKFDNQEAHIALVNPSQDVELIEKLTFLEDGTIGYRDSETLKEEVIEHTFTVLGLNCTTLKERRKEKWLNTYVNYYGETGMLLGIQDKETLNNILEKLIEGKVQPDEDSLLEPFYFVEIAFLKSLFNAHLK